VESSCEHDYEPSVTRQLVAFLKGGTPILGNMLVDM
jgi:hypothetical protein